MKQIILLLIISTGLYSQTDLRREALELKSKPIVNSQNMITTYEQDETKFCTRTDTLIIGKFFLKKAVYIFRKNQLDCIIISIGGDKNCDGILTILKEIYGKPVYLNNKGVYIWEDGFISCWYTEGYRQNELNSEIVVSFKK